MSRALAAGTTTASAAAQVASMRERFPEQAMLWMTYPDTIAGDWLRAVLDSGVDGVLLPERTSAHASLAAALEAEGLALAHFVASPPAGGDAAAAARARGYVMVQARPGPTGGGGPSAGLPESLRELRAAGATAPLAVGFGIGDAESARGVAALGADAVIVGSAAVEAALAGADRLRELVTSLREALDA
jgi:tryptophan synthase alpha chain